jgi:hypothetical protein
MGADCAGFYTYLFVEDILLRLGVHNADRIHPEWQAEGRRLTSAALLIRSDLVIVRGHRDLGLLTMALAEKEMAVDAHPRFGRHLPRYVGVLRALP